MRLFKVVLVSLVMAPVLLFAQLDRGEIVGTVTDPEAAVVPEVKLQVRNADSGATYSAESNGVGDYLIANLPTGTYIITFEAPGFKKLVRRKVAVGVGETSRVDVKLEVGAVTESVEVSAEIPRLATESPVLGTTLTGSDLTALPMDFRRTRDPASYAFVISPGVGGNEWTAHVNGSQSYTKDTLVDGASLTTYMAGAMSHVM